MPVSSAGLPGPACFLPRWVGGMLVCPEVSADPKVTVLIRLCSWGGEGEAAF